VNLAVAPSAQGHGLGSTLLALENPAPVGSTSDGAASRG
jgi:hypothetical protein